MNTKEIIQKLTEIGTEIGFEVGTEVSKTALALQYEEAPQFTPRVDQVWSLKLGDAQANAIARVTGEDVDHLSSIPVVGIEVEGSDSTTKTLESDVANIAALGPPLGLVVSNYSAARDIFRRASRAIRSMRLLFGNLNVLPVDACWLKECEACLYDPAPDPKPLIDGKLMVGGGKAWSLEAIDHLRALGTSAGFKVVSEWAPPVVEEAFKFRGDMKECTWDPDTLERKPMKVKDYLTNSKLDLVWFVELPAGLRTFIRFLRDKDPDIQRLLVNPSDWAYMPVVGFELETSGGKHAGGGLLNLSAHSVIGVCAVPDAETQNRMKMKLETYSRTLGLRNVYVRQEPWIP